VVLTIAVILIARCYVITTARRGENTRRSRAHRLVVRRFRNILSVDGDARGIGIWFISASLPWALRGSFRRGDLGRELARKSLIFCPGLSRLPARAVAPHHRFLRTQGALIGHTARPRRTQVATRRPWDRLRALTEDTPNWSVRLGRGYARANTGQACGRPYRIDHDAINRVRTTSMPAVARSTPVRLC